MHNRILLPVVMTAIVTAATLLLGSCKKEEPVPVSNDQLVGLWAMTIDEPADGVTAFSEYLQMNQDGTFQYYNINAPQYGYSEGTFKTADGVISLLFQQSRSYYVVDSVVRYTSHFDDEYYWSTGTMTVTSVTTSMITAKMPNGRCYLYRTPSLPKTWNAELSAPLVEPAADALTEQWDEVSVYQITAKGVEWFYFYNPEKNGVTLHADGSMTHAYVVGNSLKNKLQQSGLIAAVESIYDDYEGFSWTLSHDTLTVTCTAYTVCIVNDKGEATSMRPVQPEQPITLQYNVYALTDYYMIWFEGDTKLYHAFHNHPAPAALTPAKSASFSSFSPQPAPGSTLPITTLRF